jgi:hypothetical protein
MTGGGRRRGAAAEAKGEARRAEELFSTIRERLA